MKRLMIAVALLMASCGGLTPLQKLVKNYEMTAALEGENNLCLVAVKDTTRKIPGNAGIFMVECTDEVKRLLAK